MSEVSFIFQLFFLFKVCLMQGRAATDSQLPTVYYFEGCVCTWCRVADASYRASPWPFDPREVLAACETALGLFSTTR